jgi:hypothetical protein
LARKLLIELAKVEEFNDILAATKTNYKALMQAAK